MKWNFNSFELIMGKLELEMKYVSQQIAEEMTDDDLDTINKDPIVKLLDNYVEIISRYKNEIMKMEVEEDDERP